MQTAIYFAYASRHVHRATPHYISIITQILHQLTFLLQVERRLWHVLWMTASGYVS